MAAKAVCFGEALRPEFKQYAKRVVENAGTLAKTLQKRSFTLVANGTDTALMLVDLRSQGLTGKSASASLERAGLTCNKNAIPGDPQPPAVTSGVRLSSNVGTTRGLGVSEFQQIGNWIADVLQALVINPDDNTRIEKAIRTQVTELCRRFPIYS